MDCKLLEPNHPVGLRVFAGELSGDVARILGKDSTSREQLVAEVRQFLTQKI